jgi:hypothetical protein
LTLLPPTGQMLEHSLPVVNFARVEGRPDGRARHESSTAEQRKDAFFGTLLKANHHENDSIAQP